MNYSAAYARLAGALHGTVLCDEPMARHTTYRIGGPAALYIECASFADLKLVCEVLEQEAIDCCIVGKGSNLLVNDEGYDGAVISLCEDFAHADFGVAQRCADANEALDLGEEYLVSAGAATPLAQLVQKARALGLSGLEYAVGIPGTLGGALFMNAGTKTEWIGPHVASITVYVPGQGLKKLQGEDIAWEYRSSGLAADEVIVEASLHLRAGVKEEITTTMQVLYDRRVSSQPLSLPSCGSVFKNPPEKSAAGLIASCGLAGAQCGDAEISRLHPNFIVNNGSAHANEVLALMRLARDRVEEKHGVRLAPELKFLGFPL